MIATKKTHISTTKHHIHLTHAAANQSSHRAEPDGVNGANTKQTPNQNGTAVMTKLTSATLPELAKLIPAFPHVVQNILESLENNSLQLDALAQLTEQDVIVSSRILAAANANRRYNGMPDLHRHFDAVMLIGLDRVRQITISESCRPFLQGDKSKAHYNYYLKAMAVAITAQELAAQCGISQDLAYICGILHNVGERALYAYHPHTMELINSHMELTQLEILKQEQVHYGFSRHQVGAFLAKYWRLPQRMIEALALVQDYKREPRNHLSALLMLAVPLAKALDIPICHHNRIDYINPGAVNMLGLNWHSAAMRECFSRCRARFRHVLLTTAQPAENDEEMREDKKILAA